MHVLQIWTFLPKPQGHSQWLIGYYLVTSLNQYIIRLHQLPQMSSCSWYVWIRIHKAPAHGPWLVGSSSSFDSRPVLPSHAIDLLGKKNQVSFLQNDVLGFSICSLMVGGGGRLTYSAILHIFVN